jgi:hypothetical protein
MICVSYRQYYLIIEKLVVSNYCAQRFAVWLVADFEALSYQVTKLLIRAVPLEYPQHRQLTIPRVGNWCSFISVCLSYFQLYFLVIVNLHQPIHEAQIYFVFLSVGK